MRIISIVSFDDTHERACFAARKAVELDPELAEAHIAMAYVTMYYGNPWTDAEAHWNRALELDPESSLAHSQFTLYLAAFGRDGEVLEHGEIARQLDPLEPFVPAITACAFLLLGQMAEAIRWGAASLDLQPDYPLALLIVGIANSYLGEHRLATDTLEQAARLTHRSSFYLGILGLAYARAELRDQAEGLIQELDDRATDQYISPASRVPIHLGLGDRDATYRRLQACIGDHTPPTTLLCTGPMLFELLDESRFVDLFRQLQLPVVESDDKFGGTT